MSETKRSKLPVRDAAAVSGTPPTFECGTLVDLYAEATRLRVEGSSEEHPGRTTKMLVKHTEFKIVLVAMRAGNTWEEHETDARIIVQPIFGHIRFRTPESSFDLREGQILVLNPGVSHDVSALEESAFLLTLSSVIS